MTEKEKMLAGRPYKSMGKELTDERLTAHELTYDFNHSRPSEMEKRNEIILKLFENIGKNFYINPPFYCDYGYNISVGDNFYANFNCIFMDCAQITIGNNVFIAPNVGIYTAGHPIHYEPRNAEIEYAFPIKIGSNVWIGASVIICPNVSIGDNVVIGAGSVVTKDIPSNTIAMGNPCKVIREITDEDKNYYFKKMKLGNI